MDSTNILESFSSSEKLYPSTKFLLAVVLSLTTLLLPVPGTGYYILMINIILAIINRVGKEYLSTFIKVLLPIALLMFVFQLFIVRGQVELFSVGPLSATEEGLDSAIKFSSNIIGVASSIVFFFQTTKVSSIIKALENTNLPKNVIFVINSTMLLVPQASQLSNTIMEAQQSRGVEMDGSMWTRLKSFVPLLSPLVLSTISANEEKVLTLESRGYSSPNKKTVLFPIYKQNKDRIIEAFLWTGLIALIAGRVFIWR